MNDAVDPALVAVRLLTYGLAILTFGWAAFDAAIAAQTKPRRLPRALAAIALALSALAYLGLLTREASGATGWPSPVLVATLAVSTGFGRALAVTAFAGVELAIWARPPRGLWLGMAGLGLAALAFVGHGADGEGVAGGVRLATMALHLLAVGAWLGALPALYLALRGAGTGALPMLRRFGRLGAVAVALVLATGAGSLAFVALGTGMALGPIYTRVLLAKLALVAGLLALASINRFRLTPAIAVDAERALRALRRSILVEQALGLGAIAAVSILGQLDPTM